MYNKFMNAKELNVKVTDIVSVQGHRGTVTEVIKGKASNGNEYTNVRVHFTDELAGYGQYQDGVYGGYEVIEEEAKI